MDPYEELMRLDNLLKLLNLDDTLLKNLKCIDDRLYIKSELDFNEKSRRVISARIEEIVETLAENE